MMASSRLTTPGSKRSREISPLRIKPVSYVMPLARTCLVLPVESVCPEAARKICVYENLRARILSGMLVL
jgi:hypothetical protein